MCNKTNSAEWNIHDAYLVFLFVEGSSFEFFRNTAISFVSNQNEVPVTKIYLEQ